MNSVDQASEGDIVYLYLNSNVLRVGTFVGRRPTPMTDEKRMCIAGYPRGLVYQWIRDEYIRDIEVVGHEGMDRP